MGSRKIAGLAAAVVTLAVVIGAVHLATASPGRSTTRSTSGTAATGHSTPGTPAVHRSAGRRPNIVFVLMDDASYELLSTMRHARQMQADGATYSNVHVVDSLCCPSRASILTGRAPHQTGVLTNTPQDPAHPIGGFAAFAAHHDASTTFNLALHRSGYTTGFIGKYLNGYDPTTKDGVKVPPPAQPGWDHFDAILSSGYPEWGFLSAHQDNGGPMRLEREVKPPEDSPVSVLDRHYATNVEARNAVSFIRQHRDDTQPYFLEVATYAPHAQMHKAYPDNPPFPPAFRDRPPKGDPSGGNCGAKSCSQLSLRDLVGYADPRHDNAPTYLHQDGTTSRAPSWNHNPVTLTAARALREYRNRARMVQAVDRMVGRVRKAVGPDTYVLLTSDNGYHLGQLRLNGGKGTPYDFDTHVPLVVDGPGVTPGTRRQWLSNMDFAPTFEKLAGITPPSYVSGLSFARSLHHPRAHGSTFVFYDHTYGATQPGEVDNDTALGGDISQVPSYIGVRGKHGLLARFDLDDSYKGHRYAYELYQYGAGFEKTNVFAQDHDKPWARQLMRHLKMWDNCTPAQCRAARS
jgi:arylsulfatase A-like enzyme